MRILVCEYCGILVDESKLTFPDEEKLMNADGTVNADKAVWSEKECEYIPAAKCPVCNKPGLSK